MLPRTLLNHLLVTYSTFVKHDYTNTHWSHHQRGNLIKMYLILIISDMFTLRPNHSLHSVLQSIIGEFTLFQLSVEHLSDVTVCFALYLLLPRHVQQGVTSGDCGAMNTGTPCSSFRFHSPGIVPIHI